MVNTLVVGWRLYPDALVSLRIGLFFAGVFHGVEPRVALVFAEYYGAARCGCFFCYRAVRRGFRFFGRHRVGWYGTVL